MPASSTAKPTAVITLRERPPAPKAEEIGYPRACKADQAKAEKQKTSVPEMPQSPADIGLSSEVQVYVSGRNGIKYPARLCTRTGRIRILDQDGVHPLKKAWEHLEWLPVGLLVRHAILKAGAAPASAASAPGTAQAGGGKPRLSRHELESMNLRWITIHPNGDDAEGQPVLVHDDGTHYTVVGGAGGKLNQLVMPHGAPKSQAEMKTASKERQAKREERQKQRQSEHPEEYGQYEEKREALKQALKDRLGPLQKELSQEFGRNFSFENLHQMARAEALRENPNADEKEIQKVQKKAETQVKQGLRDAAEKVVKDHMDQQSLRDMNVNIDKETKTSLKAKVLGHDFMAEITPERRAEIMNQIVGIEKMKREIRALDRAMRSGDTEAIRGIEVQMSERDPTPEEVEDWTRKGYLSNKEVLTQTALTKGALDASPVSQGKYQAAGASDAANAIANEFTGHAIMDSDRARLLGPEGTARVTAAWLANQGVDLKESGQKLEERHAQMSYAKAAGCIKQAIEMDEITDAAMAAAKRGDGTVEWSQAGNLSMQMQSKKAALFCSAQGNLRTNVASHLLLTSGQLDDDMDISGGRTFTESHKKAAGLGLAKGDYKLQRKEGKVSIVVPAANVHKMATGVKIDDPERDTAFAQMENDVAANFDTKHWPGMKEGGDTPRPYQHQCLIAESLVRFKKMLVNAGAGCIHPDTIIEDAVSGVQKPVWQWMEAREAPRVWALNEHRTPVLAQASVPFIKAFEPMYRVETRSGLSVTVAAGHRFLTSLGWTPLRTMRVGQSVSVGAHAPSGDRRHPTSLRASLGSLVCPSRPPISSPVSPRLTSCHESYQPSSLRRLRSGACRLQSSSARVPSVLPEDDQSSCRIPSRTRGRCNPSEHPVCGERPRWAAGSAQEPAPSPSGALARSRTSLRVDDLGRVSERNRTYQSSCLPSRLRFGLPAAPLAFEPEESPTGFEMFLRAPNCSPGHEQFADRSCPAGSSRGSGQSCARESSGGLPSLSPSGAEFDELVAITFVGYDFVFDLEVFEHHNYLAQGIWHHNSGKTRSYYMAASSLLHGGQIEKGIITMPLAPFSKQEDGIDPETGQGFVGERKKWCDDKTQDMFVSCGTTPELRKALDRVKAGEKLVIVTTHNVFKRNVNDLLAAGIGGSKSAVYGDEAQDLAMRGEKGSQRSRAFRDLTKNAEYSCVSSGTLIERDAKELHSLSEMIHPGALPDVKKFQGEWQRAARQDDPSQVARLRGLFAGRMVSYHKPVQRTVTDEVTGESRREGVPLLQKDEAVHLHPAQNEAIADSNRARRAAIAPNSKQIAAFQRRASRDWANQGKPQGANEDPADYRARQPRKNESEEQFVGRRASQIENNARTSASMQHVMRSMQISTQGVWVDPEGKLLRDNPTDVDRAAGLPGKPMKDASHIEGAQFVNPKMDRVKEITEEMRDRYAREFREGKRKDPHFKFGLYSTELAPIEAAKKKMDKLKWTQITGSEDAEARRKAAIAINDRRPNIRRPGADAVAFTSAGNYGWDGQGMDAQFISHVIPSPGKEGQIIARGYREGQERDFHAFRVFSDDFRERALGYRIQSENATQVDLLKKMDVSHAADGDDTPLASVIAANMDRILAVAGIDPEEAARRIIGKQRVQKAIAVVSVRKKKRPDVTFEAMEQGESAEKVRMKSVITIVRKAADPAETRNVKGVPVHVYRSVQDFKRSGAIYPNPGKHEEHKTMLTSEGHVLHWRGMGLHHQQLERAAKVKGAAFGVMVHNGGGSANGGASYARLHNMRPHADTAAFQAAHEAAKRGKRADPERSQVAHVRSDRQYQVPRGSLDKALRKAIDPQETGKAPAGAPSSIETMNQRLKYEMARSAAKYDEHRKDLADRSKEWQRELGDLNRTYKALRPKAEKAIEKGITEGSAGLLVEYMNVCHRRYRLQLALSMASHATQKPGEQAIGRQIGMPVQQPLDPEYFGGESDAQTQ